MRVHQGAESRVPVRIDGERDVLCAAEVILEELEGVAGINEEGFEVGCCEAFGVASAAGEIAAEDVMDDEEAEVCGH
jgi:hypothetical protein